MRTTKGAMRLFTVSAMTMIVALGGCSSTRPRASTTTVVTTTTTAVTTTLPPTTTIAETTTTVPVTEPPTTTTEAPTTTAAPTTTTIPIITEGAVVLIANTTKINGAAAKLSNQLAKVGFHLADPTNGAGSEEFTDTTHIYVLPGGEAVAGSLALILGGVAVTKMPVPAPITAATAGLGDATVLIMLGKDLAGHKPPGL